MTLENWFTTGGEDGVSMVDSLKNLPLAELSAQVRYQQKPVPIEGFTENTVTLAESVWGASVGQSLVIYHGNVVVGGGVLCATN
jgi:tRNA U34 2-thiouridine synthase MnmA/TrmU